MSLFEKIKLLLHIVRWRFSWGKRRLGYRPAGLPTGKFITAREAAAMIPDGSTVFSCGMAGNARCSVFFWAIREAFQQTGHPRDLSWMNIGAQGGRGRVPGTVEELALPGLLRRYLAGHLETAKALLRLADAGQLELLTLPQGVMARLLEKQGQGKSRLHSQVGRGTFLDPRTGTGAGVTAGGSLQLIRPDEEGLTYTMPKVEVALFNAPYADAEGNIYFHHAACLSENVPSARAARANGGLVMATVSAIIPHDPARISMKAGEVDFIVVHPYNEQTASVRQRHYWSMFTPGAAVDVKAAEQRLKFINEVLHITPVRNAADNAMERLAATVFAEEVAPGSMINIGVGHPEEVARLLVEQDLGKDLVFTTEAGAYGGTPVPGIFFGAAISPQKLISSSEMFEKYRQNLGAAVLGFLEVDGEGNVNASKRGPTMLDSVGPGGFPDIVDGAQTIIFIGSWMAGARIEVQNGGLRFRKTGKPKFVRQVAQVTFSAREALHRNKKVFYVTQVGIFRLTPEGLLLQKVMPGIDIDQDILRVSAAPIILPGDKPVPVAGPEILTGKDFILNWAKQSLAVI